MGKLSPEKAKQLEQLEAERDAVDDDDLVVWVRNLKGHETRLEGDRARRWLAANGYDEDDAEESSAGEPLEQEGAAEQGKPAAAVKKAKPAVGGDVDGLEELEADKPAQRKPRFI